MLMICNSLSDAAYIKKQSKSENEGGADLEGLPWDGADLLQVGTLL